MDHAARRRYRAVKLLKGNADEAAKNDFVRECESMLALDHPNLVRMIAVCVQQPVTSYRGLCAYRAQ